MEERINLNSVFYPEYLYDLAKIYRTAKKVCRKCYKRLPPDATKCSNPKCHNTDIRFKKKLYNRYEKSLSIKIENDFYKYVKKLKY